MKRIMLVLAFLMLASPVYADGGGEGDNTGCNGQGNPNSPCEPTDPGPGPCTVDCEPGPNDGTNTNTNTNTQGQQQGQQQGQIQGQVATGGSVGDVSGGNASIIIGGSEGGYGGEGEGQGEGSGNGILSSNVGDTTSTATNGDQTTNVDNTDNSFDGGNTLIIGGGQGECYEGECEGGSGTLNSNANATGGSVGDTDIDNSSSATGGDSNVTVNIGEDGPLTASSQEVATSATIEEGAVVVEGDSTVYEAPVIPVTQAATSFASICTSGLGGQRPTYGISIAVTSDVCLNLMVADACMAIGDQECVLKHVKKSSRFASWKTALGYVRTTVTLGIL